MTASIPPSLTVLGQLTGEQPTHYHRISALLQSAGLKRFRAAVAYARWDGLGLVAQELEKFLKAGGEFQSIYGIGNGVTTPDSFLYSLYLKELYATHTYAGAIEDEYKNATFHPKLFEFRFADRTVALVGSANFTGAGLSRNFELGVELEFDNLSATAKELGQFWDDLRSAADAVTIKKVRELKAQARLGSEKENETSGPGKHSKPPLPLVIKAAPKPLFHTVLEIPNSTKKAKVLTKLDPATDPPTRLFLQVFETETGGQKYGEGYQVQLPRATLASYFGVGPAEERLATFEFGKEVISTPFTHFYNNTHRIRLRPILTVKRPAILIFERIGDDRYQCRFVPHADYAKVLASKCTIQTRQGARRWGLE